MEFSWCLWSLTIVFFVGQELIQLSEKVEVVLTETCEVVHLGCRLELFRSLFRVTPHLFQLICAI